MTRQELIQELMEDSQTYCCYCGAPKVRFGCCGENHFETFAEMNKETQESILSDMASEVSDFWKDYVPEPVKPAQSPIKTFHGGKPWPVQDQHMNITTTYDEAMVKAMIAEAVAKEREACAKLANDFKAFHGDVIADAIRARSNT
ncbi:hypothetical protein UFOVP378_46 [uncultured Caudovirales phage]|uniref:Uncharacterized protein n=1 Tax=uncultured Caudovirales phage TaxID=2100421 RepID=A0A6J7WYG0_9CAUD|nr:hypothetical protein UFOVP378_46 [uncultured Caudovirales phage]